MGISFHDWVAIVHEIVWEFETIVTHIPLRIWLLIILAAGVNVLARNYPKSVNPSAETSDPDALLPNENLAKA